MEVYEKVNCIINDKRLSKRAFSNLVRGLEPKLRITGEIPSENTIYSYLTGRITIPIELIPYIAEALDITEQELFDNSSKAKKRYFQYLLNSSSKEELEYFLYCINSQIKTTMDVNGNTTVDNKIDEKIEKFIKLLSCAPADFLDKATERLKEYEKLDRDI